MTHAPSCISFSAFEGVDRGQPLAWVIRTREAPMLSSSAIQEELREATGGLPVARPRTMDEVLSRSTSAGAFNALVLTIFGGVALFLAAIGIYGLIAYSVTQRTQELGIRMALGAESGQIRNMVALEGLQLALTGVVCGLALALGLTRLIAGFLFGVKPWDPQVFLVVPVILAGIALIAAWGPAVRAGRIDPMDALRSNSFSYRSHRVLAGAGTRTDFYATGQTRRGSRTAPRNSR